MEERDGFESGMRGEGGDGFSAGFGEGEEK